MTISRVRPGQPIGINPLNDVVDFVNVVTLNHGNPLLSSSQSGVAALAINKSGIDLVMGDCASIIYDDATPYRDDPTRLEGQGTVIKLRTPEAGDDGNFVICGAAIPDGQAGVVYSSGIILARLQAGEGSDDDAEFADVDLEFGGNPQVLKMRSGGAARILDVITETNDYDINWALIKFPVTGGGTFDRPYIINRINDEDQFPINEVDAEEVSQLWDKFDEYGNLQDQYPGTVAEQTDGLRITICCRVIYDATGDQILHAYYRDLLFDSSGMLIEVSVETQIVIDAPEDCT